MLPESLVFLGLGDELAGLQRVAVRVGGDVGEGGVDRRLQVLAAAARIARTHVGVHAHGALAGAGQACVDLDEVTDGDRAIEADAACIDGHSLLTGPFHRAGGAGGIDPLHRGASVDLAAPVDVGRLGHEAVDDARGAGLAVVGLFRHLLFDVLAQFHAGLRGLLDALFFVSLRDVRGHLHALAGLGVLGHEDDQAVAGAGEHAFTRVGGEDLVDDVHGAPSGHGDAGAHLHDVPGRDRAGEVNVAHVCGDAIGRGPLDGTGVGGFVDPLEDASAGNALRTSVNDVRRGRHEAKGDG